jgi:hypothetical protein
VTRWAKTSYDDVYDPRPDPAIAAQTEVATLAR